MFVYRFLVVRRYVCVYWDVLFWYYLFLWIDVIDIFKFFIFVVVFIFCGVVIGVVDCCRRVSFVFELVYFIDCVIVIFCDDFCF